MGDDTFNDEQAWEARKSEIREAVSKELEFRQAGSLIEMLTTEYAMLERETGGTVDYGLMKAMFHLMARASRRRQEVAIEERVNEQYTDERDIERAGGISSWMVDNVGGPFAQGMGEGMSYDQGDAAGFSNIGPGIDNGGHANTRSRIELKDDDEQAQPIQPGPMRDGPWLARCDLEAFWYVMVWGGDAYSVSELNHLDVPHEASYQAGVVGPRSIKAGQYCQYNPTTGHIEPCPSPEPASSNKPGEVGAGEEGALNRLETLLRRERDEAEARRRGVVRQSTPAGSRYATEALPPIDTSEGASNLRQFPSPLKGVEDMRDATI